MIRNVLHSLLFFAIVATVMSNDPVKGQVVENPAPVVGLDLILFEFGPEVVGGNIEGRGTGTRKSDDWKPTQLKLCAVAVEKGGPVISVDGKADTFTKESYAWGEDGKGKSAKLLIALLVKGVAYNVFAEVYLDPDPVKLPNEKVKRVQSLVQQITP